MNDGTPTPTRASSLSLLVRGFLRRFAPARRGAAFSGSEKYWEDRYASGRDSGLGSYGKFAEFKAEILNEFVRKNQIATVIEFGCGDGNQLKLARYPRYLGFDVSQTAVQKCRTLYSADPSKTFRIVDDYAGEKAELSLSLDVVYHLVEDEIFENYMRRLFASSDKYVIIYSSNQCAEGKGDRPAHVRHRRFTPWVQAHFPDWELVQHIPNRFPYQNGGPEGSLADFFIYARRN